MKNAIGENHNDLSSLMTTWVVCLIKSKATVVIWLSIYENVRATVSSYTIRKKKFPVDYQMSLPEVSVEYNSQSSILIPPHFSNLKCWTTSEVNSVLQSFTVSALAA